MYRRAAFAGLIFLLMGSGCTLFGPDSERIPDEFAGTYFATSRDVDLKAHSFSVVFFTFTIETNGDIEGVVTTRDNKYKASGRARTEEQRVQVELEVATEYSSEKVVTYSFTGGLERPSGITGKGSWTFCPACVAFGCMVPCAGGRWTVQKLLAKSGERRHLRL